MSVFKAYLALVGMVDAEVLNHEPLSHRTAFRIGGAAALTVIVHSFSALRKTLDILEQQQVSWVMLGKGSHIIASDAGYNGCVLMLDDEFSHIHLETEGRISVGAGALLSQLIAKAAKAGLSGLEPLVGIPGTVAGALCTGEHSSYGHIADKLEALVVLRAKHDELVRLNASDLAWDMRGCMLDENDIILELSFLLDPTDPLEVEQNMKRMLAKRTQTHVLGFPHAEEIFAGDATQLLKDAGLAGALAGSAEVAHQNPNIIINTGGATARDVLNLMNTMYQTVLELSGVALDVRIRLLGFGEEDA